MNPIPINGPSDDNDVLPNSGEYVYGMVFPLSKKLIDRILVNRRLVYVKYPTKNILSKNTRFRIPYGPGTKILFYETGGPKMVRGETVIRDFQMLSREAVLNNFNKELFLSPDELNSYMYKYPGRENKLLMTFFLKNPIIYECPRKWLGKMTMVGQHIDKAMYEKILFDVGNQNNK